MSKEEEAVLDVYLKQSLDTSSKGHVYVPRDVVDGWQPSPIAAFKRLEEIAGFILGVDFPHKHVECRQVKRDGVWYVEFYASSNPRPSVPNLDDRKEDDQPTQ